MAKRSQLHLRRPLPPAVNPPGFLKSPLLMLEAKRPIFDQNKSQFSSFAHSTKVAPFLCCLGKKSRDRKLFLFAVSHVGGSKYHRTHYLIPSTVRANETS